MWIDEIKPKPHLQEKKKKMEMTSVLGSVIYALICSTAEKVQIKLMAGRC